MSVQKQPIATGVVAILKFLIALCFNANCTMHFHMGLLKFVQGLSKTTDGSPKDSWNTKVRENPALGLESSTLPLPSLIFFLLCLYQNTPSFLNYRHVLCSRYTHFLDRFCPRENFARFWCHASGCKHRIINSLSVQHFHTFLEKMLLHKVILHKLPSALPFFLLFFTYSTDNQL